ncbi:hypothetical protein ECG_07558 [Echinococcus granulosus]|nr:hypothetical protein ECG_07558 [Echinococcus granulosus]
MSAMLRIAAVLPLLLLLVAYCSDADPLIWGSRIIGTPMGRSPPMHFRFPGKALIVALMPDGTLRQMSIISGSCYVDSEVVGRPCQMTERSANITLLDVSRQAGLQVWVDGNLFSTTFFVSNCTAWRSPMGEIDLRTSAPLSRFPKGRSQIELRFGVRVSNSRTWTAFYVNGGFACSWRGGFLVFNESRFCRHLLKDVRSGVSIFAVTISPSDTSVYSTFGWRSENERLVVTVDWTQSGESPAMADCNGSEGEMATTSSSSSATTSSSSSSGPRLAYTVKTVLAPLSMLILLSVPAC